MTASSDESSPSSGQLPSGHPPPGPTSWYAWLGRAGEVALRLSVAATLSFMMFLTFVDVMGRYFLNAPVPAGFEFTELALGIMVFSALPLLCIREQHVTVDLFAKLFRGAVARWRAAFVNLFSAMILAVLAWRLLEQARRYTASNDVTLLLNLPMAPFAYIMMAFSIVSALCMVVVACAHIAGRASQAERPMIS